VVVKNDKKIRCWKYPVDQRGDFEVAFSRGEEENEHSMQTELLPKIP
jgi:hypothetical protein